MPAMKRAVLGHIGSMASNLELLADAVTEDSYGEAQVLVGYLQGIMANLTKDVELMVREKTRG